jgi:hypothetical protein
MVNAQLLLLLPLLFMLLFACRSAADALCTDSCFFVLEDNVMLSYCYFCPFSYCCWLSLFVLQLDALCPHSNFVLEDNVMEATLLPFNLAGNPILHPGIMYARWHDYT